MVDYDVVSNLHERRYSPHYSVAIIIISIWRSAAALIYQYDELAVVAARWRHMAAALAATRRRSTENASAMKCHARGLAACQSSPAALSRDAASYNIHVAPATLSPIIANGIARRALIA